MRHMAASERESGIHGPIQNPLILLTSLVFHHRGVRAHMQRSQRGTVLLARYLMSRRQILNKLCMGMQITEKLIRFCDANLIVKVTAS